MKIETGALLGELFFDIITSLYNDSWTGRIQVFSGCGCGLAGSMHAGVTVFVLLHDASGVDIVESPFRPCSIAALALVALGSTTIDQLLF